MINADILIDTGIKSINSLKSRIYKMTKAQIHTEIQIIEYMLKKHHNINNVYGNLEKLHLEKLQND